MQLLSRAADFIKARMSPDMHSDLIAFLERAERWKPSGYDAEMALRLDYYLGSQEWDVTQQLKMHFPLSWQNMAIHTARLTRKVVDTRAHVFSKQSRFPLITDGGVALPDTDPGAKRWSNIQRSSDLRQRLKTVNRWAELLNTVLLAVAYDDDAQAPKLTVLAPQFVNVEFDPAYPFSIQRARGVMVELAGENGAAESDWGSPASLRQTEGRRFEFWTTDPNGPVHVILDGDGHTVEMEGMDGSNPYRDERGRPVIPIVPFHAHDPELGFFSLANGDLVRENRSLNLTLTDMHYIARCQGFGQVVIERSVTGGGNTGKGGSQSASEQLAMGPAKALVLKPGEKASVLQAQPLLAQLESIVTSDAKRSAVFHDVPAGAVLADSRTIASAAALVVEREPLIEAREEQVDHYRKAVEETFRVMRVVNNWHAPTSLMLPADATMAFQPGDLRVPFAPQDEQDTDLVDLANDLVTLPQILSKRSGITVDEARQVLDKNREENEQWRAEQRAKAEIQAGAGGRRVRIAFAAQQAVQAENPDDGAAAPPDPAPGPLTPAQQRAGQGA